MNGREALDHLIATAGRPYSLSSYEADLLRAEVTSLKVKAAQAAPETALVKAVRALKQLAEAQAYLLAVYRTGDTAKGGSASQKVGDAKEKLEKLGITGKW